MSGVSAEFIYTVHPYFQPNFVVSTKIWLIRISSEKSVQPAEFGWGVWPYTKWHINPLSHFWPHHICMANKRRKILKTTISRNFALLLIVSTPLPKGYSGSFSFNANKR